MNPDELIGMSIEDATTLAKNQKKRLRAVKIDGFGQAVTQDLRSDRYNVVIQDGVIEEAYIG